MQIGLLSKPGIKYCKLFNSIFCNILLCSIYIIQYRPKILPLKSFEGLGKLRKTIPLSCKLQGKITPTLSLSLFVQWREQEAAGYEWQHAKPGGYAHIQVIH